MKKQVMKSRYFKMKIDYKARTVTTKFKWYGLILYYFETVKSKKWYYYPVVLYYLPKFLYMQRKRTKEALRKKQEGLSSFL